MHIDRSGHDPEAIAGALKASDDCKANPEVGRHAIHLTTVSTRALDHPDAIDHAETGQRPQVVGHRFGDARREPIDCGVARDIGKIENRNRARGGIEGVRCRLRRGRRRRGRDRGHEAIPSP